MAEPAIPEEYEQKVVEWAKGGISSRKISHKLSINFGVTASHSAVLTCLRKEARETAEFDAVVYGERERSPADVDAASPGDLLHQLYRDYEMAARRALLHHDRAGLISARNGQSRVAAKLLQERQGSERTALIERRVSLAERRLAARGEPSSSREFNNPVENDTGATNGAGASDESWNQPPVRLVGGGADAQATRAEQR